MSNIGVSFIGVFIIGNVYITCVYYRGCLLMVVSFSVLSIIGLAIIGGVLILDVYYSGCLL